MAKPSLILLSITRKHLLYSQQQKMKNTESIYADKLFKNLVKLCLQEIFFLKPEKKNQQSLTLESVKS